jgi:hypothetical protein
VTIQFYGSDIVTTGQSQSPQFGITSVEVGILYNSSNSPVLPTISDLRWEIPGSYEGSSTLTWNAGTAKYELSLAKGTLNQRYYGRVYVKYNPATLGNTSIWYSDFFQAGY